MQAKSENRFSVLKRLAVFINGMHVNELAGLV
jgi:hypothetical protein